jgi:type IV secretory pathway VirD2 relaxase
MANRDDDRFRPRVGPPKARGRGSPSNFISRVLKQTSRAGRTIGNQLQPPQSIGRTRGGKRKQFGRGQVAARLAGRSLDARARRVTIKTRLVNLKKASIRSTEQYLRYIERDGVTREGGRGQLFGPHSDTADAGEFEQRGRADRHQFRIIVSPEDGHELGDLRAFARDLMSQAERDLGTKLDWVGVEHWDTDQPHIHLVIRGKDERGNDLVIAPDYLAHGMRARASELATRWLGRRSEREIRQSLANEVAQERWTSLDRAIQAQALCDEITVHADSAGAEERFRTGLLIGRLDRLTEMGLAKKLAPLTYQLSPNLESTLRALGERGDIIRTMQRAMGLERREYVVFDHTDPQRRVVGRVAALGLADELNDQGYLIVDAVDGRAHYIPLPAHVDFTAFATGSIVEVRGAADSRRVDRNIEAVAENGIYRTQDHLAVARAQSREGLDVDAYVQSHVRRLEALLRASIVDRIEHGVWRVPADLISRAAAYDAERAVGARVEARSILNIDQQVKALGATWLDQQLVGERQALATHGFGAEVRNALGKRTQFLIEHQLAERRGQRVLFARDLLATLRRREIDALARTIESETGLRHRPATDGQSISGIYRRSFTLASGRFAMLDDATGFSLVPWRPVIERRLGQPMSAIVRGQFVSWDFGRTRGPSR